MYSFRFPFPLPKNNIDGPIIGGILYSSGDSLKKRTKRDMGVARALLLASNMAIDFGWRRVVFLIDSQDTIYAVKRHHPAPGFL